MEIEIHDVPRIAFNINLALSEISTKPFTQLALADLGGGVGLFSVGCAALGVKRMTLIDDFADPVNRRIGDSVLAIHRKYGVEVVSADVVAKRFEGAAPGPFDIVTSFDSIEHWHHSPKRLFRDAAQRLNPGGVFVLGAPNCVNLRKRLTVPLGFGKWSGMSAWYDEDAFRGHVREPDVEDLKFMARDMGLTDVRVCGRNWLGHQSPSRAIRLAALLFDYPLRLVPSLCADIYVVGTKASWRPSTVAASLIVAGG